MSPKKPKHRETETEVVRTVPRPPDPPRMVERVAVHTGHPLYRIVETVSFLGAVLILFAYMVVEVLRRAEVRIGTGESDHGFPYGLFLGALILIAPKLIGKAFAGRALSALAGGRSGSNGVTAEQETGGA